MDPHHEEDVFVGDLFLPPSDDGGGDDEQLARRLQQEEDEKVLVVHQHSGGVGAKKKSQQEEDDEKLALLIQQEEDNNLAVVIQTPKERRPTNEDADTAFSDITIQELFVQFDKMYFEAALAAVCVEWSKRMTLCAGVCVYQGKGGMCAIKLSEPLLKFRPRKDMVDTLLHEMIHAYLFVTQNNKDHNAHGSEFQKLMNEINLRAGTHISVYHNFTDEVDYYRTHWWKCDGPCRDSKYEGLVKRAMNRPPGPTDPWWTQHQQQCGGQFIKIKEPPEYSSKKRKKDEKKEGKSATKPKSQNILNYFKKPDGGADLSKRKADDQYNNNIVVLDDDDDEGDVFEEALSKRPRLSKPFTTTSTNSTPNTTNTSTTSTKSKTIDIIQLE